jgi:hypothetical protein
MGPAPTDDEPLRTAPLAAGRRARSTGGEAAVSVVVLADVLREVDSAGL